MSNPEWQPWPMPCLKFYLTIDPVTSAIDLVTFRVVSYTFYVEKLSRNEAKVLHALDTLFPTYTWAKLQDV